MKITVRKNYVYLGFWFVKLSKGFGFCGGWFRVYLTWK